MLAKNVFRHLFLANLSNPAIATPNIVPNNAPLKGGVAARLLSRMPPGTFAVYAGDDVADEPAFIEVGARSEDALTLRVGRPRLTAAQYYLRSPREMWELLRRMEVELS